ncbi:hypothetical protein DFH08DRAFT_962893 [Mycena albidolilacea]|uniref:Uncharacterized protein n=1 Tax=Mycena albidolilacea TaxID=1033008 RepID=A0AAD6ZW95_9AGAR|nr:hypothetical protein DFH08DRAFT_962893 [Mycena albidolilacea]
MVKTQKHREALTSLMLSTHLLAVEILRALVHPLSHHPPPTDLPLRRAHLLCASSPRPRTPLPDRSAASPPRARSTTSTPPASTHSPSAPSSKCRPTPPSSPQRRTSRDAATAAQRVQYHSYYILPRPLSSACAAQPLDYSAVSILSHLSPSPPPPSRTPRRLHTTAANATRAAIAAHRLPVSPSLSATSSAPCKQPAPTYTISAWLSGSEAAQRSPRRSDFSRLSGSSAFPGPGALDAPLSSTPRFALEPADF